MSTAEPWRFDRARLAEALGRWLERRPDLRERVAVSECLMDLVIDPLAPGAEDGSTGIFVAEAIARRTVLVVYVPDPSSHRIAVVDIDFA